MLRYSGLCRDSFKQRIRICDLLFKSLFLRLHRRRAAVWSRATAYGFIPWFASEDCTEPSLLWTSSSEFLLETEQDTSSFQYKYLSGYFYNQKLKSDLSSELVAHCDPGDQLQLRIMYLGCTWFGEWGNLGFENKSSIVIYMQTISMNDLCSTFVSES